MPRPSKRARLWLRPPRRDKSGQLIAHSTWLILDAGRQFATGCAKSEVAEAEKRLAEHIAAKHRPERAERQLDNIALADVLSIYDEDRGPAQANRAKLDERLARLNEFWGSLPLAAVTGAKCREYEHVRGSRGGARRDLEDLRAAINHHGKEGFHRGLVRVVLPPKGSPRERWLTRSEAARLLWACWRYRERQRVHRGSRLGMKSRHRSGRYAT